MIATISHPVPVRWLPPRSRIERLSFDAAETRVEIPEVPHRSLEGRYDDGYNGPTGWSSIRVHAGRSFERVTAAMAGVRDAHGARPATLEEALAALGPGTGPSGLARPGTPLCALAGGNPKAGHRGAPLPDAAHAGAAADNTAAARRALGEWVRDRMVTDGESLYVARSMPVVHTEAWQNGYFLDRHPATAGPGIGFEPDRFDRIADAVSAMSVSHRRHLSKLQRAAQLIRESVATFPYGDDDLRALRQDGPAAIGRLLGRARERGIPEDELRVASAVEARLRPFADVGTVGAVAEADHALVEDLVAEAASAILRATPAGQIILGVRDLLALVERVARPSRDGAPDADAEALLAFAPGH